ncbi:MAG: YwaF family protein [Clostridia bacterium]|nr:YwaF family protein [Clostridia bacterium]
MLFAKAGIYEPCGIFTVQHFILMAITIIGIIIALKYTVNRKDVQTIIKKCTIFVCVCEIIIITFKIINDGTSNINNYVPLYYCSLLIYAGLLSSFGKAKLKRAGDVFLATGGMIGGLTFIIFPTTSLLTYPMLHLVSIHSFIFHGIMVYLSLLINLTNYIQLEKKDIIYYSSFVGIICVLAYIVNNIFDSNLMFISKNFPGMPMEIIFNWAGKYFTIVMMLAQMFLPFYIMYVILKLKRGKGEEN